MHPFAVRVKELVDHLYPGKELADLAPEVQKAVLDAAACCRTTPAAVVIMSDEGVDPPHIAKDDNPFRGVLAE